MKWCWILSKAFSVSVELEPKEKGNYSIFCLSTQQAHCQPLDQLTATTFNPPNRLFQMELSHYVLETR
jgi:hypothetical protein